MLVEGRIGDPMSVNAVSFSFLSTKQTKQNVSHLLIQIKNISIYLHATTVDFIWFETSVFLVVNTVRTSFL